VTALRNVLPILLAVALGGGCSGSRPSSRTPAPIPPPATREIPPKVGLALGGGGARGFAEIGVLRVLEQEKIPVDYIAGTSVGSLIGAFYADAGRVLDAEFLAVSVTDEDLFDYKALSFFSGGFVKGERLESFLAKNLKHQTIETLKVPFAAVATHLRTGKTVVFERGSVARAVHASAAIPGVFVPVEIGGETYVDGGVTNPIPVDVARRAGCGVVLAVSIAAAVPGAAPKTPLEVAYHAITVMSAEIGRLRGKDADVLIEPAVGDVAYDDFTQKKRLIEAGETAARQALPSIRAAMAAKSRRVPAGA